MNDIILRAVEKMKGFDQKNPNHCYDLYDHTMKVVEGIQPENDEELSIAAMLHDIGKVTCFTETDGVRKYIGHAKASAEQAEILLVEAGYPADVIEKICWLVAEHETDLSSKKSMKKRLEVAGEAQVRKLLKLRRADIMAQAPSVQEEHLQTVAAAEKALDELLAEAQQPQQLTAKDLAISAKELIALGLKGPEIGQAQRAILAEIEAGRLQNTKDEILGYLEN